MGSFGINTCLPKDEDELAMKMKLPQCSSGFSLLTKICDDNYIARHDVGTQFTVTTVVSQAMGETGRHWAVFGSMDGNAQSVEMPSKWFRPYWVTDENVTINPDYLAVCAE